MKVARTRGELDAVLTPFRADGQRIGFVPTMGAIHEGHASLMRMSNEHGDVTVVSIFVNPLQFGPDEDFESYPRDEPSDLGRCADESVDVVFYPPESEMYSPLRSASVRAGAIGDVLEGAARPGHFDGVCTVVAKLFNLVRPNVAYFGQKDAQQVAVIKRMTTDLSFGIEVEVGPTIRAEDGLALSSRNEYLDESQRRSATALYRALLRGQATLRSSRDTGTAELAMHEVLDGEADVVTEYARAVDPDSFGPPDVEVLLVAAARVGPIRLIDNLLVDR